MEKTNKKTLEEIIRVDHAGERGAIKIYEGQLLALKTFKQDEFLKKKIEDMKEHEKEHYEYFDNEIKKRNIKPTKLYPLNSCVDCINKTEFDKAVNGSLIYEYVREFESYNPKEVSKTIRENVVEKYKNYSIIPETLELCVGCQVMLIQNLDLASDGDKKLVNGSRGVVKRFVDDIPVVEFTNGKEILVDYYTWEIEENDVSYGQIVQIPLKLAYAFSIHKSQGCTLDYVSINLRNIFEYGMGYVALSRVRDLSGLYIEDIANGFL